MDTMDDITKNTILISLQSFCEVIPGHVQIGKKFDRYFLLRDPISDEIIYDIDLASPLAT